MKTVKWLVLAVGIGLSVVTVHAQFPFRINVGNLTNQLNKMVPSKQPSESDTPPSTSPSLPPRTPPVGGYSEQQQRAIESYRRHNTPPGSGLQTSRQATAPANLPPIFDAALRCDVAKFGELVETDLSLVNKQYLLNRDYYDYKGYRPVHFAAMSGCTNIIKRCLDLGVDADVCDNFWNWSPIYLAAKNGHFSAVRLLLAAGAKPTPDTIDQACKGGNLEIVKALLMNESEVRPNLLVEPSRKGNKELVGFLLSKISSGVCNDPYYESAFLAAAKNGHLETVKLFIANGANPKLAVKSALDGNQPEVVAYLQKASKEKEESVAQQTKREMEQQEAKRREQEEQSKKLLAQEPADEYGLAASRYRKINGKVYDFEEPIKWANRTDFLKGAILKGPPEDTMQAIRSEIEKLAREPWGAYRWPELCTIKQVAPDGILIEVSGYFGSRTVLLKNHPKQKSLADGDVIQKPFVAMQVDNYQYTDTLGAVRTIRAYDHGVVVLTPSGQVEKVPRPE